MEANPFKVARLKRVPFQTAKEVSEATGISKSLIDALEGGSDRDVGYKKIAILAKHYGVSADYLLGLTDIKSPNTTLRAAVEYTGLSEEAVKRLRSVRHTVPVKAFSKLLSICEYFDYFDFMHRLECCFSDYTGIKKELGNQQLPEDPDACREQSKRLNSRYRNARLSRFDLIESFTGILDKAIEADETREQMISVLQSNQRINGEIPLEGENNDCIAFWNTSQDEEEKALKKILGGGHTNDKQD